MIELTYTDIVINLIGIVFITFIATMCSYYRGYRIGYVAGLAYGEKGLQEYHEYTLNNIKSLHK